MNKLIITSGTGNGWYAVVSNTDIVYKFQGADEAAQFEQVQALSHYLTMDTDGEVLTRNLPNIFTNVTEPTSSGVFDALFKGTSSLNLEEKVVIDLGEQVLADELIEVGEALIALL